MVAEHAIPPVFRIGAIAWLARVALRSEGGGSEKSRNRDSRDLRDPRDPQDHRVPQAPQPIERHILALEAAGWHVVGVRPTSTDELALWQATSERFDKDMAMTMEGASLEDALVELVRYTERDAR